MCIFAASSLELNIFKALANVSDWKKLGSHLNISSGKISQLEECGGDIEQCRKEVALEWLKEDKTASWEGLCQALELMGNETEVQAIKERYIFTQCPDAHDEGITILSWWCIPYLPEYKSTRSNTPGRLIHDQFYMPWC